MSRIPTRRDLAHANSAERHAGRWHAAWTTPTMRHISMLAALAATTALLTLAPGCTSRDCSDCETGPAIATITMYDDGSTLTLLGCAEQPFDGNCEWGDSAMVATIDGTPTAVPAAASNGDVTFGPDLVSYDHRLDTASPAAPPQVSATYGDVTSNTLTGLPGFTITGPTSTVSRGSGSGSGIVGIDFDVEQETQASVSLTSTCGSAVASTRLDATALGHIDVDLTHLGGSAAAPAGECTHRIDVAQTRFELVDPPSDLNETVVRLQALTFSSTP